MATRKRRKKSKAVTRPRRRRRSSSARVGAFDPMSLILVAAGAAAAGFSNKVIPATIDRKIAAGGKIALGALLPMLIKSGKNKMMLAHIGEGMIGAGTYELLLNMNVIQGIGEDTDLEDDDLLAISLDGLEDVEFEIIDDEDILSDDILNGDDDINVINDDILNGDDDINVINGDFDDTY